MTISSSICNLLKLFGLCVVGQKVYSTKYFEKESKKLMLPVEREYEKLIGDYPTAADHRKGIENQTLFVEMIHWLGLEKSRPLRILDLGGRGGLFAYFCTKYGHDAIVSDLPGVIDQSPNKELHELFGIRGIALRVEPFQPTDTKGEKFDLITGFRTRFHSKLPFETGSDKEKHWGTTEWEYFLKDLAANVLTDSGRIFFMLNRLQEREKVDYVPDELKEFFQTSGGSLRQNFLFYPSAKTLRKP